MYCDSYLSYCGFLAIVDPPSPEYPLWRAFIRYPTFTRHTIFEGKTLDELYQSFRIETDMIIDALLATGFE